MTASSSSVGEAPGIAQSITTGSPGDERYMETTRRLTRVTASGAAVISLLSIVACWGDWPSVEVLVVAQLVLVPFNIWFNLSLLKKLGPTTGELLRMGFSFGVTIVTSHLTHWPLPTWFWLPFITLAFDRFGQRLVTITMVVSFVAFDIVAWLDGVPALYPLSFTASAVFCALISKARVGEISRMLLEGDLRRRELVRANAAAEAAHEGLTKETQARQLVELELRQAHRLEAVGALAAGIAHEINSPAQYVGDSLSFVRNGVEELLGLVQAHRDAQQSLLRGSEIAEVISRTERAESDADLPFLVTELPVALDRSTEGIRRIARIVQSLREFAQPDRKQMLAVDLNRAVASTIEVARGEYRGVAEVQFRAAELPPVVCHAGDINQVVLNLLINAAHAISEKSNGDGALGRIVVTTTRDSEDVVVAVSDDGVGIPDEIRDRIFDPFFSTKAVGTGTGQGLAVARAVLRRHKGALTFESARGTGTTFFIRLPIDGPEGRGQAHE